MPGIDPISAGVQGAIGVAQIGIGIGQKIKAKKLAKGLVKPDYKINPEYRDNTSLAENELSTGMSREAQQAYNNQEDKAVSTSIDAILRSGGSAQNVSDVYNGSEEGRQRMIMMREQLRQQKINDVVRSREQLAEQKDKEFQINKWFPYTQGLNTINELNKNSSANIGKGLGAIAGAAVTLDQDLDWKKKFDEYFGTDSGGKGAATGTYFSPADESATISDIRAKNPVNSIHQ
jgi:hypothetical protein